MTSSPNPASENAEPTENTSPTDATDDLAGSVELSRENQLQAENNRLRDELAKLHDQFFQDPTPTDCISFPLDQQHLGEIFVCAKTAVEYATKRNLPPYEELSLYVIHGILHCLGFDDLEPSEKRIMRKKEKRCMALIKTQDLLLKP